MNQPKFPRRPVNPFETYKQNNPFAVEAMPAESVAAAKEQVWGPFTQPETIDDEVNVASQEHALEILVAWGASVLHVAHLSPPRTFVVGEASEQSGVKVDFHLPESALGRKQWPVVLVEDGVTTALFPDCAEGSVQVGKDKTDLRTLLDTAPLCPTVTRARMLTLDGKNRLHTKIGELEFFVRLVKKSAPIEKGLGAGMDWSVPGYFGLTAATAAVFMGTLAYFVPPLGLEDDAISKDRLVLISQLLDASSEREREALPEPEPEKGASDGGESGQRAEGAEGEAGKVDAARVNKRVAVAGPRDTAQLQLSNREIQEMVKEFGMIGLLSSSLASDPKAPTSVFGPQVTLGNDDLSANGALWASDIGESGGSGGLGLLGTGFGGGAVFGNGLGINQHGVTGPGLGTSGIGYSGGITSGSHVAKAPGGLRMSTPTVNGRIPPHVIQRVVRQNFGRFRMCYQQGLGRNPSLEGRIPVGFVIGRDGAVSNVSTPGGFPDAQVQSCVQSAFYGLSFPPPEGGIVKVTYPLMFAPE